ncbi:NADP-dependent oxidoreductase [Herbiconiux sp. CPCC 205763]|uniref:NADP-dependent oxidoreductase n=1 Tax=Herbiconiux aconitum TaxID=2970913 RepID=A0ABT2GNM6_9MICO|nr:NADP-dependent oxidoreductase [Herbiconiux aconitum]MCS5717726.1 NADP-dependent oxidoreductase [Herbiconiux aconitum]
MAQIIDASVTSIPRETRAVILARSVGDSIQESDFSVTTLPVADLEDGQVLVRNLVTSVDPYHLRLLRGGNGHGNQLVGLPLMANCVGVVVASKDPDVEVGTQVANYTGWVEYAVTEIAPTDIASPRMGDEADWLNTLGTPGVAAYIGLHDVGNVTAGDVVVVTGAAGSVGGLAAQIAKAAGAHVIGVASGEERVRHMVGNLKVDAGLDRLAPDFDDQFRVATAHGIDLFFDNVGGQLLEMAIPLLAVGGRAVISGTVSTYGGGTRTSVELDVPTMMLNRTTVRAFNVADYYAERLLPAREELSELLKTGAVKNVVTEFQGLESAPRALASVFESGTDYVGKRIVRIADR